MPKPPLLLAYAHPDDETFGSAGTAAHYAALGHPVYLICATRGEVGQISDPALATPETLGAVREAELRCAAEAMGVEEVIFLDYRDSGMVDTAPNADPRAFINIPAEEVITKLVGIIRRIRPAVIITFDPTGGYGHPDHLAIYRHTLAAFHAAANATQFPALGTPHQASRLFFAAITKSFFQAWGEEMQKVGVEAEQDDPIMEQMRQLGYEDDQIDLSLDVSEYLERKWTAFQCHRTQFSADDPMNRLYLAARRRLFTVEHYLLAYPPLDLGAKLTDLFEGLS
jgi:LmbE family N-acetylglucosaminyl deacetylase